MRLVNWKKSIKSACIYMVSILRKHFGQGHLSDVNKNVLNLCRFFFFYIFSTNSGYFLTYPRIMIRIC